MKRKTRTVIASLALAGALALPALAANVIAPAPDTKAEADLPDYTYAISVNGQEVDASATVMVPLRALAESLGFTVTWDNGTILVDNGVIHTYVVLGQDSYTITTSNENLVGMSAPFPLGIAPFSVDNVTYVPPGAVQRSSGRSGHYLGGRLSLHPKRGCPDPQPLYLLRFPG